MTDNKDLKYTQTFKKEPNVSKTYEQFILEEQQTQPTEQDLKITDSYETELGTYEDISSPKGYGPCSYSGCPWPSSVPCRLDINLDNM